jgi:hypothetical protein
MTMNEAIASAKSDSYDKWQAEDDLRTITRAKEIEKDKKRMANVRRAAKEKLAEMANLKTIAAGGTPE